MRRLIGLLLSALLLLCGAVPALAGDCHPPGPFTGTNAIRGSANFVPGTGSACDIVATLNPANSSTAAAFAWYSLGAPQPHWRISFRIDLSNLGIVGAPLLDAVRILSASTRDVPPGADGVATLLSILMTPLPGESGAGLFANVACSTASNSLCFYTIAENIHDGDLLRFEVSTGAGGDGYVRWWINADFGDPPTGFADDLDNAAWGGVDTVTLGAAQPSGAIATNGTTLRYYDVEEPDEFVFGNGFDG